MSLLHLCKNAMLAMDGAFLTARRAGNAAPRYAAPLQKEVRRKDKYHAND